MHEPNYANPGDILAALRTLSADRLATALLWDEREAEPDGKFRVPVDVAALLGAEYAGVRIFVVRDAPEGMQPLPAGMAPDEVEAAIAARLAEARTPEEQAQVAADALTVRKYYEALQRWGA